MTRDPARYESALRTGLRALRDAFLQFLLVLAVLAIAAHIFDGGF